MDDKFLADERSAALVAFAFLQPDSEALSYRRELSSKGKELIATLDINHNGLGVDAGDSGELESDGHLSGDVSLRLEDILPQVELQRPGGQEEVIDYQAIAQALRDIAAQLDTEAVTRAAQNLNRNISEVPSKLSNHLVNEVGRLMRDGVCLGDLPRSRVMVALTLTLVKAVCVQAPQLLGTLFDTAVRFICQNWAAGDRGSER